MAEAKPQFCAEEVAASEACKELAHGASEEPVDGVEEVILTFQRLP